MSATSIPFLLQIVLALGLLNVWLLRSRKPTSYRGGGARSLTEEFAEYGLPPAVFYLVGILKIGSAILLLAGLWAPSLVLPSAALVAGLMVGAMVMHFKVSDPLVKFLPAALMLVMSATLVALSI